MICEQICELSLPWLTLVHHLLRSEHAAEARVLLGLTEECARALASMPAELLPALARSGVVTVHPHMRTSFWRLAARTGDPELLARYGSLAVTSHPAPHDIGPRA